MNLTNKRNVTLFLTFLLALSLVAFGTTAALAVEGPPADGLNTVTDKSKDAGTLYPGDSAIVQVIDVADDDGADNSVDVTVTEVEISNAGTAGLADIAKIEVMEGDTVRGTASTVDSPAVTVSVSDFTVADGGSATVNIKVYIASSPSAGTLEFETTLVHTEGINKGIHATVTDGAPEDVSTGAEVRAGNPSKGNRIGGRVQGGDRLSQNAKFYRPGPKRKSCVYIHIYTHSAPGGGLVD